MTRDGDVSAARAKREGASESVSRISEPTGELASRIVRKKDEEADVMFALQTSVVEEETEAA